MNTQKGTSTLGLIIVLIVAVALVWLITRSISNIDQGGTYEFTNGDTSFMVENEEDQAELEAIAETSTSTDLSDLEADLDFDTDAALNLDDFEE
jgi:hypothetical protein